MRRLSVLLTWKATVEPEPLRRPFLLRLCPLVLQGERFRRTCKKGCCAISLGAERINTGGAVRAGPNTLYWPQAIIFKEEALCARE